MKERRKDTRHRVNISLSVCELYQQEQTIVSGLNTPIEVENISKGGLCFVSEAIFPLNYYFNATLDFADTSEPLFTIVKIIRCEIVSRDVYRYGCEFMNPIE